MIVIDASVWISFLVKSDANHPRTHTWFSKTLLSGEQIVAPILLLTEIGGAMARRLNSPVMGQRALHQLLAIPSLKLVSIDHGLGIEAARIAANLELRGADAIYVAVASQLDIPLVSWDQEQLNRTTSLITAYEPA